MIHGYVSSRQVKSQKDQNAYQNEKACFVHHIIKNVFTIFREHGQGMILTVTNYAHVFSLENYVKFVS